LFFYYISFQFHFNFISTRHRFNYKLSSPATCKKAVGLQAKIAEGPGERQHIFRPDSTLPARGQSAPANAPSMPRH
jgi:hypothetical protein